MKMLLKRIATFTRVTNQDSPSGPQAQSQNGSSIVWKGKTAPFSADRAIEIERRLFWISKTVQVLNEQGTKLALDNRVASMPHDAVQFTSEASKRLLTEKLALLAEREAMIKSFSS